MAGTSTFMVGAQIPGHFAMTPQAKENWPLAEPTNTAYQQSVKANAQDRVATATTPYKQSLRGKKGNWKRAEMSEAERKAFGRKMLAARHAKGLVKKEA